MLACHLSDVFCIFVLDSGRFESGRNLTRAERVKGSSAGANMGLRMRYRCGVDVYRQRFSGARWCCEGMFCFIIVFTRMRGPPLFDSIRESGFDLSPCMFMHNVVYSFVATIQCDFIHGVCM